MSTSSPPQSRPRCPELDACLVTIAVVDRGAWPGRDHGAAVPQLRAAVPRTAHRADGVVDVGSLTGVEVSAFLLAEAQRCSVGAAKGRVAELRALLRYLYLRGSTATLLSGSIPPVAGWHDTGIPPALSRGDVEALLGSCDRTTVSGLRDYAMLMLLARLGLRSIEVSRLELGDIDWRAARSGSAARPVAPSGCRCRSTSVPR